MRIRYLAAFSGLILMTACTTRYEMQHPFEKEVHQPYLKIGSGSISGQAFLRQRSGNVITAAGNTVWLSPATPYMREFYQARTKPNVTFSNMDSRIEPYIRKTMADLEGGFNFKDLPAGTYILETTVTWELPSSGLIPIYEGGPIIQEVTVGKGEKKKVVLTR